MNNLVSQLTSSLSTLNVSRTSPDYILTKDIIIWEINERMYNINLPCICLLIISIMLGTFGNAVAIYIFGFKMKRNNTNIFTTWLSVYELLTCFLNIFEVYDKRFPMYSGIISILCKFIRFLAIFTNSASAFLLLCIAFDRYFMVCKPLRRKSPKARNRAIIAAFVVPLVCVWPMGIFHGPEIRQTPYENIYGVDCADDDLYRNSVARKIFYFFVMLTIITSIVILIVLYVLIFNAIRKWKNSVIGESHYRKEGKLQLKKSISDNEKLSKNGLSVKQHSNNRNEENEATSDVQFEYNKPCRGISDTVRENASEDVTDNTSGEQAAGRDSVKETVEKDSKSKLPNTSNHFHQDKEVQSHKSLQQDKKDNVSAIEMESNHDRFSKVKAVDSLEKTSNGIVVSNRKTKTVSKEKNERPGRKRKTNMTTLMFFFVSVLYIVSFLPTVVTEALNSMGAVYEGDLSFSTRRGIVIANLSYFLNGSFNPIIYFVFNKSFRLEVINIFTR